MADKPSWIDYLNLGLTTVIGALGVYVAVNLGRSANQLSQNGLVVASATFLLDDSPDRRKAGYQIVTWLQGQKVELPQWEQDLSAQVASQSTARAPTLADAPATAPAGPSRPAEPAIGGAASAGQGPAPAGQAAPALPSAAASTGNQLVANQLFKSLGGIVPRLFIEIADIGQAGGADALRQAVGQLRLQSQLVVVPRIEIVGSAPAKVELRFLKKADAEEAAALASLLGGLLGARPEIRDLSDRYETQASVKPRTYELWFPRGQTIAPAVAE